MSLTDQIKELVQFTNKDYEDIIKIREAAILLAESMPTGKNIITKEFTILRDNIPTGTSNYELLLEPDPNNKASILNISVKVVREDQEAFEVDGYPGFFIGPQPTFILGGKVWSCPLSYFDVGEYVLSKHIEEPFPGQINQAYYEKNNKLFLISDGYGGNLGSNPNTRVIIKVEYTI
jgi:hypothetical protein